MPVDQKIKNIRSAGISFGRLPSIVLILGLLVTGIFTVVLYHSERSRQRELFLHSVRRTTSEIEGRMDTYVAMLRGGAGLVSAEPDLDEGRFRQYVRRLRVDELYNGMQGIGYAVLVPPGAVGALEERERRAGRPAFRVWPSEAREEVTAILYLEPQDERNAAAIGYDMFSEPIRRAAMIRARDTGRASASGLVRLVQEIDEDVQPGFLIYVPVYTGDGVPVSPMERRERLSGFVYAPFRARDLFAGVFSRGLPRIAFSLYDGETTQGSDLLFASPAGEDTGDHHPRFSAVEHLSIAGRRWTIVFHSTPALENVTEPLAVPGAFFSGLLVSLLLAGIAQLQRRNQVERDLLLQAERAAREESERVSRMKDEFLATLSHELRTPLTAILGWAELLRSSRDGSVDQASGLEIIQRNAEAQSQLINDLLDMSRIISGKIRLDLEPTDPMTVVTDAVEVVRTMADSKRCRIRTHSQGTPARILLDPHRMQQIVWNLLSNAVKFTPPGGRVDVTVSYHSDRIEIEVKDSGKGIDGDFLPFVFDRFRQADSSSTRQHMGLGLGLSIVKSLAELHGGTVQAMSDGPGKGAQFRVAIPVVNPAKSVPDASIDPAQAGSTETQAASVDLVGASVLLVEDERDSRDMIVGVLRSRGANVRATSNADEALAILYEEAPHLIVSDIGMPGMDGYMFIRRVRVMSTDLAAVPAIALTAFARPQDRERAIASGYQLHISKPVAPAVLADACARLLRQRTEAL